MAQPKDTVQEQFDSDGGEQTIYFYDDIDIDTFKKYVIPYTVGRVGSTHGVTTIKYTEKTITVTPLADR